MVVDTEGSLIHIEEEMKDEAATKWLLENGFDVEGNAIFPEKKNPA
jgi:very-short-patch-repair endonuclease